MNLQLLWNVETSLAKLPWNIEEVEVAVFRENPEKIVQNLEKIQQNSKRWQIWNFAFFSKSAKGIAFFTKILRLENGALGFDSKTVQKNALCRSRRELSNEYLLAKSGFDTAENEPYYFKSELSGIWISTSNLRTAYLQPCTPLPSNLKTTSAANE